MTSDSTPRFSITSTEDFENALAAAVEAAVHGDVDVRGAWEFRTGGSTHDWEVNISELARNVDEE